MNTTILVQLGMAAGAAGLFAAAWHRFSQPVRTVRGERKVPELAPAETRSAEPASARRTPSL